MGLRWVVVAIAMAGCHSSVDLFGEGEDDGPSRDAGTSDFRVPAADATPGPTSCPGEALECYEGWDGTAACCLAPGTAATCTEAGNWVCPEGTFPEEACDRIDPVCEGSDAGPPAPVYGACDDTSDCVLVRSGCCDPCGMPTAADVTAVNEALADDFSDVACPEPPVGGCPLCPTAPNPYLTAICDDGACAVVDLAEPTFNECETDGDCALAVPECCFCGEVFSGDVIAVPQDADLESLFCDDGFDCACAPRFEPNVRAICEGGVCAVLSATGP